MTNNTFLFQKECIENIATIIEQYLLNETESLQDRYAIAFGITKNDVLSFAENIVFNYFIHDINRLIETDPAIGQSNEKYKYALTYKGITAIMYYRISNHLCLAESLFQEDFLYEENDVDLFDDYDNDSIKNNMRKDYFNSLARKISEDAAVKTTIEIHPSAKIDRGFVIDHGTNVRICADKFDEDETVVVGETCTIGENCTILNGVTLGARTVNKGESQGKRHPTIGDNVTICSGARILGNINIGDNVFIAPRCIVTHDVPKNTKVTIVNQLQIERNTETKKYEFNIEIYGLVPNYTDNKLTLFGRNLDNTNIYFVDKNYEKIDLTKLEIIERNPTSIVFKIIAFPGDDIINIAIALENNGNIVYYINSIVLHRAISKIVNV